LSRAAVLEQAKLLARENRRAEPRITRVYWFPDDEEVRLVEVLPSMPASAEVVPYYFRPDLKEHLPAPSGIALIRPDEFGRAALPPRWGSWDDAVELNGDGEGHAEGE
jgi:hypothetical protein